MKLLSRLAIAFVICLLALPALTVPAQAQENEFITLSPSSGHPGEELTVRGEYFEAYEEVEIYYYYNSKRVKVATDDANSSGEFRVTFTIPESYQGKHEVRADGDDGSLAYRDFEVEPGLEIDPEEGPVGTRVTVEGTGFGEDEDDIEVRYYLDSSDYEKVAENIEADEHGSWDTTFTVPPSDRGSHKIDAKGDDSSLGDVEDVTFDVEPGISLSKSSGYVGDRITVTGSGFKSNERSVKVTSDGEQFGETTNADDNGAWEISFDIPPGAKGTHKIGAYGSSTSKSLISEKNFTVIPKVMLTPTSGHVGTTLTVGGTGLAANSAIIITYDGTQKATSTTGDEGSFPPVSFEATHTQSVHTVNHPVKVTDDEGDSNTIDFVMESTPPPQPTLNSPADGSRVGFVGSVTPTFEWSAVTDDSGVSYSLQIAPSDNFTSPLLSLTGLIGNSYTLAEDDALPGGTYYWKVKAIDGAQNDSGWTNFFSFKSGFLPLWTFIAIVVLLVVLVGFLIYFFGIRRRVSYD